MICESLLSGNILQLNIITFYSRQCASQNENRCKIQHQEQLKSIFRRLLLIPVTIQFDNNRIMSIDMKICSLTDMTGKVKSIISEESHYHLLRRRRRTKRSYSITTKEKSEKTNGTNHDGSRT
jgi:hypothetical protein